MRKLNSLPKLRKCIDLLVKEIGNQRLSARNKAIRDIALLEDVIRVNGPDFNIEAVIGSLKEQLLD